MSALEDVRTAAKMLLEKVDALTGYYGEAKPVDLRQTADVLRMALDVARADEEYFEERRVAEETDHEAAVTSTGDVVREKLMDTPHKQSTCPVHPGGCYACCESCGGGGWVHIDFADGKPDGVYNCDCEFGQGITHEFAMERHAEQCGCEEYGEPHKDDERHAR